MRVLLLILCAVIGYAFGNIPCGVLLAKFMGGPDIRKTGSGNSGTTNMLRTMGWSAALLTFAGDVLKGLLPALIGKLIGGETGMLIAGFCAVLGHNFPAVMGFKGGKGIATSLGITFIICPWCAPCLVVIVITTVAITRLMSLGSIIASLSYPFLTYFLRPAGANGKAYLIFAIPLMLLALFQHRANFSRLIHHSENKLDFSRINKLGKERRARKQNGGK